jgi:hypothetical protein
MTKITSIPKEFPFTNRFGMVYEKKHIDMLLNDMYRVSRDSLKITISIIKHLNYFKPNEEETLEKHMLWFGRMILRRELKRLDKKSEHFSNVIERFGKSEIEIETIPSNRSIDDVEGIAITEDFLRFIEKKCGQFGRDMLLLTIEGYPKYEIAKKLRSSTGKVISVSGRIRELADKYFKER